MKKIRLLLSFCLLSISSLGLLFPVYGQYEGALTESTQSIANVVETDIGTEAPAGEGAVARITNIITQYLIPIVITLGIIVAFIGAYKMMTSDKEDAIKDGGRLVLYGVIGIIVMTAAYWLSHTLVDTVIQGTLTDKASLNGLEMAQRLYEQIMLPFLKLAIYLSAGILFFILAGRVVSFLTSNDDGVRKKAWGMIAWTVIGIIVMLAAKQIVEAIFGQRTNVINSNADTLGDIGTGIFETSNIPIIYTVLNWIMGLATLVVLVLIIFQTFQLLTKPDSPDNITKIKKTLLYVAIGVLVIGTGYIISNVLLVNP